MKKLTLMLLCAMCAMVAAAQSGIYLRGDVNGFNAVPEWEFKETAEKGVYELKNVELYGAFKIADVEWGQTMNVNYGASDQALEIGKSYFMWNGSANNIQMPEKCVCETITFDKNKSTLLIVKGNGEVTYPDAVYVRGNVKGFDWDFQDETTKLAMTAEEGVYEGNVTFASTNGLAYWRIYDAPGNNNANSWGAGGGDMTGHNLSGNLFCGTTGCVTTADGEYAVRFNITDGSFKLTLLSAPNPLAGKEVALSGAPTVGGVNITLESAALAEVAGCVLKYQVGEEGPALDYVEKFIITDGARVKAWAELEQDGQVFKSTVLDCYPFVVAFAQEKASAWAGVNIYSWLQTGGSKYPSGAWPGTKMTQRHEANGYVYNYYTFNGTGFSAQDGYTIDGGKLNYIFLNSNNDQEKTGNIEKQVTSKIYTCFDKNGRDVTEGIGGDLSGVEDVDESAVSIMAGKGVIRVSGAKEVAVYTVGGALVSTASDAEVPAGFYIVKADNEIVKVVVK